MHKMHLKQSTDTTKVRIDLLIIVGTHSNGQWKFDYLFKYCFCLQCQKYARVKN